MKKILFYLFVTSAILFSCTQEEKKSSKRSNSNWLQKQPEYKDKTTLIITCDHGRGSAENEMWRHHGDS